MPFETLDHTADVGLRIWSGDVGGLFVEAAAAVFAVMGSAHGAPADRAIAVRLQAPDVPALLVDWLSELLYVFEGRGIVPVDVEVEVSIDPPGLRADVRGPAASSFRQHGAAVKAITYHGLSVEVRPGHAEARVYLDV